MKASDAAPNIATDALRHELTILLAKTASGDRAAFADVYRRTSAKLFGVCLRILPDRDSAEDALQESFISVWNTAKSFDATRASPMTWLITLARNRAIDRLRRAQSGALGIAGGRTVDVDAALEFADGSMLADDAMMQAQDGAALANCLKRLAPADSGFIQAAFLKGTTYADLATKEAIPLGTIKSRIRRALISLRACMTNAGVEASRG